MNGFGICGSRVVEHTRDSFSCRTALEKKKAVFLYLFFLSHYFALYFLVVSPSFPPPVLYSFYCVVVFSFLSLVFSSSLAQCNCATLMIVLAEPQKNCLFTIARHNNTGPASHDGYSGVFGSKSYLNVKWLV